MTIDDWASSAREAIKGRTRSQEVVDKVVKTTPENLYKNNLTRYELLLLFSEWLDAEAGVFTTPSEGDDRSHHELVEQFIEDEKIIV